MLLTKIKEIPIPKSAYTLSNWALAGHLINNVDRHRHRNEGDSY